MASAIFVVFQLFYFPIRTIPVGETMNRIYNHYTSNMPLCSSLLIISKENCELRMFVIVILT